MTSFPSSLIGKKAYPKDNSHFAGHVAFVKQYKGDGMYILAGGSLGTVEPLMHRSEFTIHKENKS